MNDEGRHQQRQVGEHVASHQEIIPMGAGATGQALQQAVEDAPGDFQRHEAHQQHDNGRRQPDQ